MIIIKHITHVFPVWWGKFFQVNVTNSELHFESFLLEYRVSDLMWFDGHSVSSGVLWISGLCYCRILSCLSCLSDWFLDSNSTLSVTLRCLRLSAPAGNRICPPNQWKSHRIRDWLPETCGEVASMSSRSSVTFPTIYHVVRCYEARKVDKRMS